MHDVTSFSTNKEKSSPVLDHIKKTQWAIITIERFRLLNCIIIIIETAVKPRNSLWMIPVLAVDCVRGNVLHLQFD